MSAAAVTPSNLLDLFRRKNALLEGHFVLSSGLHSDRYLQSALLLQDPATAEDLGRRLAALFPGARPGAVVSPAIGGLIIGHEAARALGCRAIFVEKDADGKPALRRGFHIAAGEPLLIVEDVITTGLSTGEVAELVTRTGGQLAGIGSIVNRSGHADPASAGKLSAFNVPVRSLLTLDVKTWPAATCPLCQTGTPAVKPGSRKGTAPQ